MKFKSKYITSFILAAIICVAAFCGCGNNTAPSSTAPVSSEATAISSEAPAASSEVPASSKEPTASSESAASSEQPENSSEMPAASPETPAASQAQEIEPEKEISEPQNESQEQENEAVSEQNTDEKSAEPAADATAKTANKQPAVSEQAAETPADGQTTNKAETNTTVSNSATYDEKNPWRESLGTYEEDVAAGNYTGYIVKPGDFNGNEYYGYGPDDPAPTPTYDETLKAAIDYYGGYENIPDDMKQVMGIK